MAKSTTRETADLIAGIEAGATADQTKADIEGLGIDADISTNAWHISRNGSVNFSSDTTLDFNASTHIGSNLTESGGQITVSVAGMYLISLSVSRYSSDDDTMDWTLQVNTDQINGTRAYVAGNSSGQYDGAGFTVPVQLVAGDTIFIHGRGYVHGSATNSMTHFSGVRLGA
jgi:hypothetical protein